MANPGHAKLSPSKAHTWMACPGSVRLSEGLPDTAGRAAAEGTACHALLHDLLIGKPPGDWYGGIEITPDMRRQVDEVYGWAMKWLAEHPGATLESEVQVRVDDEVWGTADIVGDSPDELMVADAKFGFNEVEARDNKQLLIYLLAAYLRVPQARRNGRLMRVAILQPRVGGPKEEVVSLADLRLFEDELIAAEAAVLDLDAPLHASPEACQYCPAAALCPENQKMSLAIATEEFSIVPERLTRDNLRLLLEKAELIKLAVKAVEDYAVRELEVGRDVPGFKRVQPNTHRKWNDDAEAQLKKALPLLTDKAVKVYKEPELKSPAQLEKALGLKPGDLDAFTFKPEGTPVLAPESDPRPAVKPDFESVDVETTKKE